MFRSCTILLALLISVTAMAEGVFVNRAPLDAQVANYFAQEGIRLQPGQYWYDAHTGAWGFEGGPTVGVTYPGLPIAAPLPADISGGGTGIFINGREIHPSEAMALRNYFGQAIPGRYWLNAAGVGGYEGGPAFFNLAPMFSNHGGSGGRGLGHNGRGGSVISDGTTSGFISSDPSHGVSVTCGPDGGCIY
ncbi:conserved hypothetical protein [Hahella chejuensis KCTC 2396]|uniref:Uncharacterized protein n=1 Tax=Hahella chejuensis (strain KCTC 2396) TaxID=349521 RepID=Q2SFI3_HAHCH|nr:hypothetical protein [Hahella chejuensis]ABC30591.1 conserved hypothetical protein [Hahella chejuensis KCTC 2396]